MKKRGQVWIETVTYTLVALVMIGLVLAFAKPKIEQMHDQAIIEQSIKMIKEIDSVIKEVGETGIGNKRKIEINLKKGELEIDSLNNTIIFYLEGTYMYSQPGLEYQEGNLNITTEEKGKIYEITIERQFTEYNLTYFGKEESKKILKASTSYYLFVTNKGGESNNIDFELN
jgi:hypothetical protein